MWKSIKIENSHIGFNLTNGVGDGHVGSITVVDSVFKNCDIAVLVANTNTSDTGRTSVSLDNVVLDGVTTWLREQNGKNAPKDSNVPGNHKSIDMLTVGRTYSDTKLNDETGVREFSSPRIHSLVDDRNPWSLPKQPYAERPKPQYERINVGNFVNIKDSCKGLFDELQHASQIWARMCHDADALQATASPTTRHASRRCSTITEAARLSSSTPVHIS